METACFVSPLKDAHRCSRGDGAASSCLPSAPPRSSAAWTCARSTGAHLPASARRRRMTS
eukprot:scaffold46502_cov73-Phaeocystis_antarctica.AAC.3